jgi:hypothetical protein
LQKVKNFLSLFATITQRIRMGKKLHFHQTILSRVTGTGAAARHGHQVNHADNTQRRLYRKEKGGF